MRAGDLLLSRSCHRGIRRVVCLFSHRGSVVARSPKPEDYCGRVAISDPINFTLLNNRFCQQTGWFLWMTQWVRIRSLHNQKWATILIPMQSFHADCESFEALKIVQLIIKQFSHLWIQRKYKAAYVKTWIYNKIRFPLYVTQVARIYIQQ